MPVPEPHKIYINGRFLGQRVTGVQRYGREVLHALDELLDGSRDDSAEWTLLAPRGTALPPLRRMRAIECGRWQGHAWEQADLAWHARDGVLLNFGLTGPLLKRRQVITVHDASVVRMPESFRPAFRWWYRALVRSISQRTPRTLAVSHFSAREAAACFGVPPERIRVGTEGWQHLDRIAPDDSVLDRHGLRGRPFALAVSSPTPNKNFGAIAQAVALLGPNAPTCVVVGARDGAVFRASEEAGSALTWVGYVSDAQLKALYLSASCFVFPSFYEGFGIPPLEAMACGCPVLASTAEAVKEVCGDAALYFDPREPQGLARQMRRLSIDKDLREELRDEGLRRARRYSWQRAAEINLEVVRELLWMSDASALLAMPARPAVARDE